MKFFAFIGGLVVFALLALFVPRLSFVILLGAYLMEKGVDLFPSESSDKGIENAMSFTLLSGGIAALIIDMITIGQLLR